MLIMIRSYTGRIFLLLLLAGGLGTSTQSYAQTSASTKTFQGPYFSFSYPSNWTLTQTGDNDVAVQAPGSPTLLYELSYTTTYGGNADQALAGTEAQLRQSASNGHSTLTFEDTEPGLLGGSSVVGYLTLSGGGTVTIMLDAVVVGRGIALIVMAFPQVDFYTDYTNYGKPITASINFASGTSNPSFTVIGQWKSLLAGSVQNRTYSVTLTFNVDGTYLYTAAQSTAPAWTLQVAGKFTITAAPQNNEQASLELNLIPQNITQSGLNALNQTSELSLLQAQGFPGIINQSFYLSWDVEGNLDLQLVNSGITAAYKPIPASSLPSSLQVLNSATFIPGPVAPGSGISIFGAFNINQASASKLPLPSSLSGASVLINGKTAPLLYAGPSQINAQVPFELSTGTNTLTVYINNVQQSSTTITVAPAAPGLFVDASGHAIAANQDYSLNSSQHPAAGGSYLSVYFTGQGALAPTVATGVAAPLSPLAHTVAQSSATIGGHPATVSFSGAAPGFVGVAQVNVQVPSGMAAGDFPLVISVGGVSSNSAKVSVKQ